MGSMQGRSGLSANKTTIKKKKKKKNINNGRLLAFGCFLHGYQSKAKAKQALLAWSSNRSFSELMGDGGDIGVRDYAVARKSKDPLDRFQRRCMSTHWDANLLTQSFQNSGLADLWIWNSNSLLCLFEFRVERGHPILKRDDKFQLQEWPCTSPLFWVWLYGSLLKVDVWDFSLKRFESHIRSHDADADQQKKTARQIKALVHFNDGWSWSIIQQLNVTID